MAGLEYLTRPLVRGLAGGPPETYPAVLVGNDLLPWFHVIDALAMPDDASPALTGVRLYSILWPLLGLSYNVGNGAYIAMDLYVAAGTWTIEWPVDTRSDYPIVQYKVDDVNVGGTFDRYAAAPTVTVHRIAGVVLTAGWHRFKMVATGKHASSSNYVLVFSGLMLTRTA